MTTNPNGSPQPENGSDREDAAPVIRSLAVPGTKDRRGVLILLGAVVFSVAIHGVLLFGFFFITVRATGASLQTELDEIQTKVEDDADKPKEANLTNDELGDLDPDKMLSYESNRQETVSVPGPVDPTEDVGIKDSAETTKMNVPPPPGLSNGQGGGLESPKLGTLTPIGLPGGLRGIYSPGGIGGRSGATRDALLREGGGNTASEAAVAAGIKWLAQHQATDGHWSLDGFNQHGHCNCNGFGQNNDIAATAFGLLPLLGAGETHKNPKGVYTKNVDRALKYLIAKQGRDGDFGGGMYAHGLATIAICEAYGMTADPRLKAPTQSAINFIRAAQSDNGGWRYEPRQGGDTSVVGWQLMALKSGQMAGLEVDDARNPTFARATRWLNSCMSSDGGYGYQGPDKTPTMTAVGLLCRLYLGTGPRNTGIRSGVQYLKLQAPPGSISSIYYYYYASQVMHHVGGSVWEEWNPKMRDLLIAKQDKGTTKGHPHLKGSWSPAGDAHGGAGGRMMTTSLSVLTLEVYYRHLPLYRRDRAMASN
jgi:hypothetical protein